MSIADVLEGRARWCVVEGDCLDVLPTLPDRSVAHVITDPPYSARVHSGVRSARVVGLPDSAEFACRTRRTVDLTLAGAKGMYEPMWGRVSVVLKGKVFYFPLFAEACIRQGSTPPLHAQIAKRLPRSHRKAQPKRWGRKLRAAQRRVA